jgi:hypothetical protein
VRRALVLVLLLYLGLLPVGCSVRRRAALPVSPYCRQGPTLAGVYHPDRLHVRSRCRLVQGVVERVIHEDYDGDVHVWLQTADERLAVEILPQDRALVGIPDEGASVTVVGPYVEDVEHGWREIHPAWLVSPSRIVPANARELARVRALLND